MNEESYGYTGVARQIAQTSSEDAEIASLEQELGVTDSKGNDQTANGQEERSKARAAQVEKINGIVEKSREPAPAPTAPAGAPAQKPDSSIMGGIKKAAGEQIDDVKNTANTVLDMGKQAIGGAGEAIQSVANLGIDFADWVDNKFANGKYIPDNHQLDFADKWFPPKDNADKLMRGAAQFLIPYAGASKIVKAAGIAKGVVTTGSIAGIATDFMAFDGDQERISNLIQTEPALANPVTEYLMSKPTDTDVEGRFKNVLEGMGFGVMTEGLFRGAKYLKSKMIAKEAVQMVDDIHAGKIKPEELKINEGKIVVNRELAPMEPTAALKDADVSGKGGKGQVNLERINEAPDTLAVIKNIADNDREMLEANIPSSLHADIKGQPLVPIEDLFKKNSGELLNEKELHSARVYLASSSRSAKDLAMNAVKTGASADKVAAMQALESARQINFLVTEAKARPAQILNSLKIKVSGDDHIKAFLQVQGEETVDQTLARLATMPAGSVPQIANKSYSKRLGDAVFESYVNNLLVNPATHVVNFTSNFATALWSTTERALAPFVKAGKIISPEVVSDALARQKVLKAIDTSKLSFEELMRHQADIAATNNVAKQALMSGVDRGEFLEAGVAQAEELANQTMSAFSGLADGITMLFKSAKEGDGKTITQLAHEAPTSPFNKIEELPPSITSENLGGGPIVDILGGLQRLPSKGLAWADNFWKAVNYRGEVHALAYRLGKKQNLAGDQLQAFVKEFAANPPDYIEAMATKRAQINTFTNPVDDQFSKRISKMIDTDEFLGVQVPVAPLKFVVPFKRTQLNIQKFALDRTPLAIFSNQYKEALAKGGADAQMAQAQMALGTSVIGALTLMAGSGTITGSGPADTRTRKLLEDSGWRPYSVKIGDNYVELKRFAPIGQILSLSADMSEIAASIGDGLSVEDAQQLGGLISWVTVNQFTPEGLVDNLGEFLTAVQGGSYGEASFDALARMGSDIAAKSIPLSGYANVARKASDSSFRVTKSDPNDPYPYLQEVVNKIKNQIPGYSNELPARKNIWGDDVTYPVGIGAQIASPFIGSKFDAKDPVLAELVRLGDGTPVVRARAPKGESHLAITMPPKRFALGGGNVELDPVKYNRLVELSAGKGLKSAPDGKPLKETLGDLIKSNYAEIGFEKQKTDQNKRILIKKYIQKYRNAAKIQLLEEYPELEVDLNSSIEAIEKARGN